MNLLLVWILVSALAQDTDYPVLAARFRSGDETVDVRSLRFACGSDPKCDFSSDIERKMTKEFAAQRCTEAIALADQVLENNIVEAHAHLVKFVCHKKLQEDEKAEASRKLLSRVMTSFTQGGMDGKSSRSAIPVAAVHEEYAYLHLNSFRMKKQSLVSENCVESEGVKCGPVKVHFFDVMEVVGEDGKEEKLYFNIDVLHKRLADVLGDETEKNNDKKK